MYYAPLIFQNFMLGEVSSRTFYLSVLCRRSVMKKILDVLGFKSVSALRKAVKNGDSNALEFLEL